MTSSSEHKKRFEDWKTRQVRFESENRRLKEFLLSTSNTNIFKLETEVNNEKELENNFGYFIGEREEYTSVGFSNTCFSRLFQATFLEQKHRKNNTTIYCRMILFDELSDSRTFKNHLLKESLKIIHYFKTNETLSKNILKYFDFFLLNQNKYLMFMEKFEPSSSLMHIIWNQNEDEIPIQQIKQWILDLSDAVESLNICGVAHRFIRAENILLDIHRRIILTAFDMACLYFDVEKDQPIIQNKLLPLDCDDEFLDHLPPECFEKYYDATHVDVWSIGCICCLLLTKNNPFSAKQKCNLKQWKYYWERRTISEDLRTLLDDIFQDFEKRMTVFDLKNDQRLLQNINSKNKTPYYRVDLKKQSTSQIQQQESKFRSKISSAVIGVPTEFTTNAEHIANIQCYKIVSNENALLERNYLIERNKSFGEEFQLFINDFYLESCDHQMNKSLAKIYLLNKIPMRHKNLLLNESTKIMKYLSQSNIEIANNVHQVMEIFLNDVQLIIFYERILHYRSLYRLLNDPDKKERPNNDQIKPWMLQLLDVIEYLFQHAISHRYIRTEYIFIENYNNLKLTHFDMACFVWNPINKIPTLRHKGLQDENELLWNHLPPECFLTKYDAKLVDVWSFGIVWLYCLTGENPFQIPMTNEDSMRIWNNFQSKHSLPNIYLKIFNNIFAPLEKRIFVTELKKQLMDSKVKSFIISKKSNKSKISYKSTSGSQISMRNKSFSQSVGRKIKPTKSSSNKSETKSKTRTTNKKI